MILHGLAYSVYTRIVRLVLEEKSVDYQLLETDVFAEQFDHHTHRGIHPFDKIPVLSHGESVLYETNAICCYIDNNYPGLSLQPEGAKSRAVMRQIISVVDNYAYSPMIWGVFVERIANPLDQLETDEVLIANSLTHARVALGEMQRLLNDKLFFVGRQLSLADLHVLPIVSYFAKTPEGDELLREYANVTDWLHRMHQRRSFQLTRSIYD